MSEALFRQHLDTQSRLIRARLAQRERRLAREAREAHEDRQALESWRAEAGLPSYAGPALSLTLPTGPLQAAPLSRRRRQRYRRHLREVIAEAFARRATAATASIAPDASGTASPPAVADDSLSRPLSRPLSRQLCGVCAGGCCPLGAEHAFINAEAVLRYLDGQPQASPVQVLQAYLEHLPPLSQKAGCVNQTAQGCSLPRAMRGETCNSYLCAALTGLQQAEQGEAPPQVVFIVQRRQNQWRRERPELDNRISSLLLLTAEGVRARKALP